ncbi:hypothetical protein [uncultured Roseobacter sp.]|uniref:hypothetical protein n=1 Tax=uncultured Roseobacter sp. TaxID=114847 RepID=UPI0026235886|nr:hypothetical protein [uncultured Roseobacter sp.]
MSRVVETPEDIAVKQKLWASTEAELMGFAEWEAREFVRGEAYSDGQKIATNAGRIKGYPIGLIRKLARQVRLGEDASDDLLRFRQRLSLDV